MPCDPWEMQLKLQQTVEVADQCPAPENWAPSDRGAHLNGKGCRSRRKWVAASALDYAVKGR